VKYKPNEIESKWQKYWAENQTFKTENTKEKPKFYVLDMFPYPSGSGLHVGHPLGYIASDIIARYKRHKGFNVLHPQGYDSFGLPAEQFAIQTGQHPALTTETNINRYREQLDKIGFSFDWSREIRTSDPEYYKWTQWIFTQLFDSYYDKDTDQAESIEDLITIFKTEGNYNVNAVCDEDIFTFSAKQWNDFSKEEQLQILLKYRLVYLAETQVNWCEGLGTVLANDEIVNGVSERGGHPVIRKKMKQWSMRISAYAERLLQGLDTIDWSESIKETQRNWIGKSVGASVRFRVIAENKNSDFIEVFTTRADTIFGVSFITLAPEHELVEKITTIEQQKEVQCYVEATKKRSERDRMADVKTVSGVFTGAYAEHPFTKEQIPIWIGDYVLVGYGTGAVMSVPCGDERDYAFAKHFDIPIKNIFNKDISENAFTQKIDFEFINSDFLNGLDYKNATIKIIEELEKINVGIAKINYRLRDAVFSRQRYWGEPFPVYYVNGLPQMIEEKYLPICLPEVEKYLPTSDGQPPLGNASLWAWDTENGKIVATNLIDNKTIFPLELNTMPGWAGSSWYWLRYMDAQNKNEFADQEAIDYWKNVDLYIGGSEHATGHLLYSRFWNKFLKDIKLIPNEEPFQKLINQGMIQGFVEFIYLEKSKGNFFKHYGKRKIIHISEDKIYNVFRSSDYKSIEYMLNENELAPINVYSDLVKNKGTEKSFIDVSGIQKFIFQNKDFKNSVFVTNEGFLVCDEGGSFKLFNFENNEILDCSFIKNEDEINTKIKFRFNTKTEIGKMSKRWRNVVNPDDICQEYGADTLRLYEMFLGPLEQAKPWNTAGITGVFGFLKKLWRLYFNDNGLNVSEEKPTPEMYKSLHKTIKKVTEDIENFSFNTSVSQFMICVNELSQQKCNHRAILEPLAVLISPYAPHIAEELWSALGHKNSISRVAFPKFEEKYLIESNKEYPVSFNGKMRFTLNLSLDLSIEEIEKIVLADPKTRDILQGNNPKKIIVVPGKIINIVI